MIAGILSPVGLRINSSGIVIQFLCRSFLELVACMRPSPISRTHFANFCIPSLSCGDKDGLLSRIFIERRITRTCFHICDASKDAFNISARSAPCTTGNTCLKSPPNRIGLPPNGLVALVRSSTAQKGRHVTNGPRPRSSAYGS